MTIKRQSVLLLCAVSLFEELENKGEFTGTELFDVFQKMDGTEVGTFRTDLAKPFIAFLQKCDPLARKWCGIGNYELKGSSDVVQNFTAKDNWEVHEYRHYFARGWTGGTPGGAGADGAARWGAESGRGVGWGIRGEPRIASRRG